MVNGRFDRRKFLSGLTALSAVPRMGAAETGDMPYRDLGSTGARVSAIGIGGFHLGAPGLAEAEAIRIFQAAVERGINFSDNAWDYNGGESERRVGKALKGRRDRVFVMTKFDGRTKTMALKQLDESLARLQTDHLDLWQMHENIRLEDPDRFFAEGGAVEAVLEARSAGKVRFVGFTGHKDPVVHLRMLEMAEKRGFRFDTAQMPLNVMDTHFRSFEHQVLPLLVEKKMGVLGMKSMGDPFILRSNTVTALECLQYALSLPTSVVITGIDKMEYLDQAFAAVKSYRSLGPAGMGALREKTAKAAAAGKYELFKTTTHFDSTEKHPEWLG